LPSPFNNALRVAAYALFCTTALVVIIHEHFTGRVVATPCTMAASARARGEVEVRAFLVPNDTLDPSKKVKEPPLIDLQTGKLGKLPPRWQGLKQRGGWFGDLVDDPANDMDAAWEQYIMFEQKFYINHPLVSWLAQLSDFELAVAAVVQTQLAHFPPLQVTFNDLLRGQQPVCHKCDSKHKPLQSHGWRKGTHPVLSGDGEFYVISFGLLCPDCPQHKGKSKAHSEA